MSNISNYTSRFRAHKNTQQTNSTALSRRPRETTVCNRCRTSKLRCDRVRPACGSCVKKGEVDGCVYDLAVVGRAEPRKGVPEERLAHLETLVRELMHAETARHEKDSVTAQPITPEETIHDKSQEHLDTVHVEPQYVGSTHWSAVLDEIDGLRADLTRSPDVNERSRTTPFKNTNLDSESIFGSSQSYSLQHIIDDYLPPKAESDRLLAIYFQGENFIQPFVHMLHFQRKYQHFWSNISSVNPLWLSMLFSIFRLASFVRMASLSSSLVSNEGLVESAQYHAAAGKCLVVGRYHQPQEFVVEALVMYAHGKSMFSLDIMRETGAILAMAVRSAYQLGYHRDPDLFKGITPFEGEMRRRTWSVCKQMDLMLSFQLGLPSTIVLENCDTRSLSNLLDTDFGPESKALPPSRPHSEATRLLWFVVKDGMMVNFARVCRDALSHEEKTQSELQELDLDIERMKEKVPESLKMRPFLESIGDSPFIVVTRFYLEFIYLKSLCVLHRKYMARHQPHSTSRCLDAGMRLVSQFLDLYRELSPGGQLEKERWMLNCYTMNDFLLGTTILCLYLQHRDGKRSDVHTEEQINDEAIIGLLEQAHNACIEKSTACNGARRVAQVIRNVVDAIRPLQQDYPDNLPTPSSTFVSLDSGFTSIFAYDDSGDQNANPFDFLNALPSTANLANDMDWAMFDTLLLGQDP